MSRSENQKLKLLVIKEYLERNTDENHYATLAELTAWLEQKGITAERKSIYRDLECLEEFGCDILR
ncbi:MAG: WYL domain-containing protein, partial [Oscillospiraceae bacterium]|nr:WYL domain-containing protein [Oscillospiraceae bacterium]